MNTHSKETTLARAPMKRRRFSFSFQSLFIATALTTCAAGALYISQWRERQGESEMAAQVEDYYDSAAFAKNSSRSGNYLSGRFAAQQGDYDSANQFLSRTLRFDAENLDIAGYVYRTRLLTGDMEGALTIARLLYDEGDRNANPEIMLLLDYVKNGSLIKASKLLGEMKPTGFNAVVAPLIQAWIDCAQGKITAAILEDGVVEQFGEFSPFILYQYALVNDLAGFEDDALRQYYKAMELSKALPFRLVELVVNLHERRGENDRAQELIARFRKDNPDSVILVEALEKKGKEKPARLVKDIRDGIAEMFFSTASILQQEGMLEEAQIYANQVLYMNADFEAARVMLGAILEEVGHDNEAMAQYNAIPAASPYYYKAQLRRAYVFNAMGEEEQAMAVLKVLEGKYPKAYQTALTQGDILMRLKRFEEAAEAYTTAIGKIDTIAQNHWPVFYARGISYERSHQWDKAEKDFQNALQMEPNQPDVLNYLGYSWLTQNIRVDEALRMIEVALNARPEDAHIVDSMGWALYRVGDYANAMGYLEQAIELMPTDPTVNEHLGDVYWKLGRKHEARFQWNRAALFNPDDEQMETLQKKIAQGIEEGDAPSRIVVKSPEKTHVELLP